MIVATQLKVGNVIMHNGKPHRVTNVVHVTPGNWRGMVQTRLVNIETGSNAERDRFTGAFDTFIGDLGDRQGGEIHRVDSFSWF